MLDWLSARLSSLRDPGHAAIFGGIYIASYYLVSALFIAAEKRHEAKGPFVRHGPLDWVTTVLWFAAAVFLVAALFDVLSVNALSMPLLLIFYLLFAFAFGFIYNLIEWHAPGNVDNLGNGWPAEARSFLLSLQALMSAEFTAARPKSLKVQFVTTLETLLGLVFFAVFVARSLTLVAGR